MEPITLTNFQVISLKKIPVYTKNVWRDRVIHACRNGHRPLFLFATDVEQQRQVWTGIANDRSSAIMVLSTRLEGDCLAYPSLTPDCPAFHHFERELYEVSGILPQGHPWLKPVRTLSGEQFFMLHGEDVHEVAVGPVHAGIIEPGHFRFMCYGEQVQHLEIRLGYQHRGIESLIQARPISHCLRLSESICGDTLIGHTVTTAALMEAFAGISVSQATSAQRALLLELERVAMHLGDLAAISGDIAFQPGNAVFAATRTRALNLMLDITGNRFGRGAVVFGGHYNDFDESMQAMIRDVTARIRTDATRIAEYLFSSAGVMSRLQITGSLTSHQAVSLGIVGMPARASAFSLDTRYDFPSGIYIELQVPVMVQDTGDVYARTMLRYRELLVSLDLIARLLPWCSTPTASVSSGTMRLQPESLVCGLSEGWRGEIVHVAITDKQGNLSRYKIKDPSFNNWYALAVAMRGNAISDFPLCNKSFNLSYSGHDL